MFVATQFTMSASSHSHAPWRKAILIPFWVLQLGLEIYMMVVLALSVNSLYHNVNEDGDIYGADTYVRSNAEHVYAIFSISHPG
jgi:hypothetical protein